MSLISRSIIPALSLLAVFMVLILPTTPAYAVGTDPLAEACEAAPNSTNCQSKSPTTNPVTGTEGVLYKITTIIAVVGGVAAVVMIMVSGFRYITSGGDAQKVATAKNTLIGSVAGLIIVVLAQTIITFVVKGI
jgi:hypothetical protein